jgi:hypothetical protein
MHPIDPSKQDCEKSQVYLPPAFTLGSCSAYSSTLKMEAICSSETSVHFQRTIQRYIPENSTLQSQVQFIAFTKYLEIQYSYRNMSPEQNTFIIVNLITHNYIINNSLTTIQCIFRNN